MRIQYVIPLNPPSLQLDIAMIEASVTSHDMASNGLVDMRFPWLPLEGSAL